MLNTQYTSRNEDANVNSSFAKVKGTHLKILTFI